MNPALPGSAQKEFQRAVALFNEGRLATAEGICTELIARFPLDPEIAHFGGVVANRMGRYEVAVERLGRCLQAEPGRARAHAALGFAQEQLGRFEEASDAFAAAIQAEPSFAEAHNGLGVALLRMGRGDEALACFGRALSLNPASVEARLNAARVLQDTGRSAAAAESYREALKVGAHREDVLRLCALGLQQAGDLQSAVAAYRMFFAKNPADAESRGQFALALAVQGDVDAAFREIAAALAVRPAPSPALLNAHGLLLLHGQRWAEAAEEFRRAAALDPDMGEAHANLAMALLRLGRREEAREAMREAEARPGLDAEGVARLGAMYGELGDSEKCIQLAEDALRASPFCADAHVTLSIELLRTGDFERGWREHAYRPTRGNEIVELIARGSYPPPLPSPLAGRDVLILAEQGLGDALFFLRYAKPLADAGARLHVMGLDSRLEGPVRRSIPIEIWPEPRQVTPEITAVWAGDLPAFVRPLTGSDVCAPLPIAPLPMRTARMRERLGDAGRSRIGIAWHAGTPPAQARMGQSLLSKEIAPGALGEALAGLPFEFVSIQRLPSPQSARALEHALGAPLVDCSDVNADIEDMLALLSLLDDYVGVSSTNVHLLAALGRPGRILVPFPPDWRWQLRGESPWFPGFRTYRQQPDGDWSDALRALREDLAIGEAK